MYTTVAKPAPSPFTEAPSGLFLAFQSFQDDELDVDPLIYDFMVFIWVYSGIKPDRKEY